MDTVREQTIRNPIIRDLTTHADRLACVALQELTWGAGFSEKAPPSVLIVAQKTGGIAAGAFAPDGALLGFILGFTGLRNREIVHWAHMIAVVPDARGQGLSRRLMDYMRDHCRAIGVREIEWSYDPLVARNAHVDVARSGGRASEYVISMYGDSNSTLHRDVPTDRFIVRWAVDPAEAAPPVETLPPDLPLAVGRNADELPLIDAPAVGVRIPRDITELIAHDTPTAQRWRAATRRAFTHYLASGYEVRGFVRDDEGGTYLLAR